MKILFIHDHIFHRTTDGVFFSGGGLPRTAWSRYLNFCDSLRVVGREGLTDLTIEQTKKLALSSRDNVDFILLPSLSGLKNRFNNYTQVKLKLFKEIATSDRVVVRLPSELGLLAVAICNELSKPVAVEMVDCPWDGLWNYGSLVGKLYAPFMYFRIKRAVKSVDYVIYVTSEFLQSRYPAKISAVTSSCSNVMLPDLQNFTLDNRLAKPFSKLITFGLIGSLKGKLKGVYDAILAVKILRINYPNIRLRVLGDGDSSTFVEYAKKLEVADIVFFDGVLPSGEPVFEWLDSIDVYIHPSYKEGLPRAVIEAMSRGCPVTATNVAGTPELVDERFLFNPGDVAALASKMRELCSDPALRAALATRNFEVSRRYESTKLDGIRFEFWSNFFKI